MVAMEVGGQMFAHQQNKSHRYQIEWDKEEELPGEMEVDQFPDGMVGGPWVEVYSPNGKNNYKRRRCRTNIGGQTRKTNIGYLGSV